MMKIFLLSILIFSSSIECMSQNANTIQQSHEAASALKQNKHMVFARTPVESNKPGNASQTFKGDDFIYGRVFFTQTLREALFLEENEEGMVPADIYVEDLTNKSSLYISLNLKEEELDKTFFDFDILPDPERTFRESKEFETGRFSYFITETALENRKPVYKFTVGDATGYMQIDFTGINLQQIKARDLKAYQNAKVVKAVEGQEQSE